MKREKYTAKIRPDAPFVFCDCDFGKETCPECGGAGEWVDGHPNDPSAESFACERCEGNGEMECRTCEGAGGYPDPSAVLECARCGSLVDEDTNACVAECGYVWKEKAA